ncbi:hypothetical protein ACTWP4_01290 [Gracilibacillus sp. D59]|uniref:hypothetical protein n=1 Tax=Gracilibacillus sp. D59 TaxID=3457434 RepID=UPI003FCD9674
MDNHYDNVGVELTQDEINQVLDLYNSVPEERISEVKQVPSDLKAGITFDLKKETEIRIQYDGEKIYKTYSDKKGQKKYVIDYPELNTFFDNKLEEKN